jgi:hypothetical protein
MKVRRFFLILIAFTLGFDEVLSADLSQITIYVSTSKTDVGVHFLVSDPSGKRTGRNPVTGRRLLEIPGAGYVTEGIDDDVTGTPGTESMMFSVRPTIQGKYVVELQGMRDTEYELSINASNRENRPFPTLESSGTIKTNEILRYVLLFDPTPGGSPPVLQKVSDDPFSLQPFSSQLAGACQAVSLTGNARIEGPVLAGGAVTMSGNSRIVGNLTSASLKKTGNARVDGQVVASSAPVPCAFVDMPALISDFQAANDNARIPANYLVGGKLVLKGTDRLTLPGGRYLLESLDLSGNAALTAEPGVRLLSKGKASLSGNAKIVSASGDVMLYVSSPQGASMSGNSQGKGIVYAPGGPLKLTGNAQLSGRAFAKDLDASGDTTVKLP